MNFHLSKYQSISKIGHKVEGRKAMSRDQQLPVRWRPSGHFYTRDRLPCIVHLCQQRCCQGWSSIISWSRANFTIRFQIFFSFLSKIFGQSQDRDDVPNVLVLFSDGQSHDHSRAVVEARKMKEKGVSILCVAIGSGLTVNRLTRKLKEISSKPEYTFNSSVNALNTIEDSLVKNMCDTISKYHDWSYRDQKGKGGCGEG